MRVVIFCISLIIGMISHAQDITPIMSAGVKFSKNDTNNTFFLSPDQVSKGFYESIELMEIDNTLVLRCEDGKVNEYGFVEENTTHSIMFKISNLTYQWIDPVKKEGILFQGTCSNKKLGYDLPFVLRFNIVGSDVLSVGHNVKTIDEVRNYNLNRLFYFGKEVTTRKTTSSQSEYKQKVTKKHKPKLTK